MKRIPVLVLVGTLLGAAIGSLAGPSVISYWYDLPASSRHLSCVYEIEWAMATLVKFQLAMGGLSAIGVIIVGMLVKRYRRKLAASKTIVSSDSS